MKILCKYGINKISAILIIAMGLLAGFHGKRFYVVLHVLWSSVSLGALVDERSSCEG